jgi:AmiR/NasT family two-component response regulator
MIKILIVEDEAIVARDLHQQLAELGYDPVADTPTGEQALALAAQLRPGLVLMDIELAGEMDGISAAQAIGEQFAIPVVYLTAYSGESVLEQAKLTEAFGYVLKPFAPRDLRIAIEMALYKHRTEAALRKKNAELEAALARVKTLSGLLPICAGCKKIRDDKGYWSHVESYVQKHSEATFTHGLCPDCIKKWYPELEEADLGDSPKQTP